MDWRHVLRSCCCPCNRGEPLLKFDDFNWLYQSDSSFWHLRAGAAWTFGIDISVGKRIAPYTDGITGEQASLQLVRDDFSFEKGQKIGMAVYMTRKPTLVTSRHRAKDPLVMTDNDFALTLGVQEMSTYILGKLHWWVMITSNTMLTPTQDVRCHLVIARQESAGVGPVRRLRHSYCRPRWGSSTIGDRTLGFRLSEEQLRYFG